MQQLTPQGQNIINDISSRYNLSYDSAVRTLVAVNNGGGTMAQFSCQELGSGQWMRGGMTMVSDMFNHGLKATVNNLCGELSSALANNQMFLPAPKGSGNNWWPGDLGTPSSSGSQNNIRYAYFPQTRRLVVQRDGQVSVFDTQNHHIGGVSQQQGGSSSLTFTSQYGTISTLSLPLVSGPGLGRGNPTNFAAPPAPTADQNQSSTPAHSQAQTPNQGSSEVMALLEQLGKLKDAGILTEQEFMAKKTDLLTRL
ncbi:MAG: SHOCT domain-containing protein [Armatimonadetes bacterium]|nr:SHOCT domain-containing protein [Akkermansiaceae bacterium]